MDSKVKIGEAAAAAGVSVQTLRYYEKRGLLDSPNRTDGGFRLYSRPTILRIRFIKKAQALGFSLEEINELLALDSSEATTCGDVKPLVDRKVVEVQAKIEQLSQLLKSLLELRETCPGKRRARTQCPLLTSLVVENAE